jgi:hypothetical protein
MSNRALLGPIVRPVSRFQQGYWRSHQFALFVRPNPYQCIMKKRPASEGRSCDGRSNCNGESGAKEPQKDIGKSAREWHFDLEGKDNR